MKVKCIDDSHRPEDISLSNWIKKNKEYTVSRVIKINMTGDLAFELEEVATGSPLYAGYNVKRFVPIEDSPLDVKVEELELVNS
jgi:hypothetical protein